MKIKTKNFKDIEVLEENIITFKNGIPGFSALKKFILIEDENNKIFTWLQSIEDGDISIALLDMKNIMTEYDPKIKKEMIEELGEIKNNLLVYNVVVIPENIKDIRVNLVAPIVINLSTNKGVQVIVENKEYKVKHYIYELLKK